VGQNEKFTKDNKIIAITWRCVTIKSLLRSNSTCFNFIIHFRANIGIWGSGVVLDSPWISVSLFCKIVLILKGFEGSKWVNTWEIQSQWMVHRCSINIYLSGYLSLAFKCLDLAQCFHWDFTQTSCESFSQLQLGV
jgi:hypothetical protein